MTAMGAHLHVQYALQRGKKERTTRFMRESWNEAMGPTAPLLLSVELVHCTDGDIINMMVNDEPLAIVMWMGLMKTLVQDKSFLESAQRVGEPLATDENIERALGALLSVGRQPAWCHAPHGLGDSERTVDKPVPTERNE